jgi:hypothetical protein
MSAHRVSRWGIVPLVVFASACEIDSPPALRQALARDVGVARADPELRGAVVAPNVVRAGPAAPRPASDASSSPVDAQTPTDDEPSAESQVEERSGRVRGERFPRPRAVRALYANAWAAGSSARMDELLGVARRTEINALVVDIKDASGYVSHRTEVALAHADQPSHDQQRARGVSSNSENASGHGTSRSSAHRACSASRASGSST